MRKALILSLFAAMSPPAFAADAPAPAKPGADSENSVPMPSLIAPVVVDGRLQGYFYISSRVKVTNATTGVAVTNKIAFIQDAFVRDVNANPMQVTDPAKIDRVKLGDRLVANARKVMGNNSITGIIFGDGAKDIGIKFASLRPDAAPLLIPLEALEADAAPAPVPKPQKAH